MEGSIGYLRTVRVTAGVYPGFGARALPGEKPGEPVPLTFGHWPGVGPYTSPFGLAGTCVFVKQSPQPLICDRLGLLGREGPFTLLRLPFSRSYGDILQSSLAGVIPRACGYSPRPPVAVSGTVTDAPRHPFWGWTR